jgi:hypothetical protein
LDSVGDIVINQDSLGMTDSAEAGDWFGDSLATGDFDGDGFYDLAIGIPKEDVGLVGDAGAVHVVYGSSGGLDASRDAWLNQNSSSVYNPNYCIADFAEMGDQFGSDVAVGDVDGDGYDDLVIGVEREDIGTILDAGAVNLLFGDSSGIGFGSGVENFFHQDMAATLDNAEAGDRFGGDLAVGDFDGDDFDGDDFDGDGYDDIAIGVRYEDLNGVTNAGAVNLFYGGVGGPSPIGSLIIDQNWTGQETNEADDRFGASLTVGDFDGDGRDDLAVGAVLEDIGAFTDAGAVHVIYGDLNGLTSAGGQLLHQDSPGIKDTAESGDQLGYEVS